MKFYLSLLIFFCFCEASLCENQNRGFSVELIGPDSSRSPFYVTTETLFQRVSNILNHSINRISYLNHVFSLTLNNTPQSPITPYMGFGYVMSYSIGTPPFQVYGIIDTASNLGWIQCKACNPCFNQTSPMFDPSKSSTYKTVPCSSPICKSVDTRNCSSDGKRKCEYNILYLDNSNSQGDVFVDTLTLNSNNFSHVSFPRFVIGCGHKNKVPALKGTASGAIGLGRGSLSLISQLGSSIGGKFSYCLVPLFSNSNISSKLNFGDTSVVYGPGTLSIPLDSDPLNLVYYTTLEAFSVGDHVIEFHDNSTLGNKGNTLIDSGTTLTCVPEYVYSRLESVVASMVKLKRVKDPIQKMTLCYKTTLNKLEVPIITAHFIGGDVHLNAINTFIQIDHETVCFAFVVVGHGGVIFGNVAQQNFLVGFDIPKNIVSFKPTDCTKH